MHLARAADVHENGTIVISPAICGDKILSEGEECDDGLLGNSAEKADACRRNCTKASCGDGVTDTGEQCDEGPSGGLNCTKECQAICPVLPNVTNATISYGGGRVYGTHVSYVCNGTGLILDGSSTRSCLANGTWNGTAPTECKMAECSKCTRFPNSKILTTASWDDKINSWLPSSAYILAIYSGVSAAQ